MSKKLLVQCASIPAYLSEETAREVDDLVKTLPAECKFFRKSVMPEMTFEPGEKSEVSIINTNTVDREGEVILPEGINMDSYRKNMVVLFDHDHERPVARCTWVKLMKNCIRAKTNYDLPENTPDCDFKNFVTDCWAMVMSGVMKAKSVGLLPITPRREPTPEELTEHPEWAGAVIRDSCVMLEYSLCSTGVNQDCLVEAVNNKSITEKQLQTFGIHMPKVEVVQRMPTKAEVIASVLPFLPKVKKAVKKKTPIDISVLIENALKEIDVQAVIERAKEIHKNRGRV